MDREDGTGQADLFRERKPGQSARSEGGLDAAGLRYEGPSGVRQGGRTGPSFIAAALLVGAVVVLVGVTLVLRGEGEERAASVAPPPPPPPLGSLGDDDRGARDAGADRDRPLPSVPADAADRLPPAPGEAAPSLEAASGLTLAPTYPAGPRDEPASLAGAAPGAAEPSVGDLVRAGDLEAAVRTGGDLARQAASRGDFTVQVLAVRSPQAVREAFGRVRDGRLVVVALDSSQGTIYRLLWGFYPTREEARKAAASCPPYFPRSAGWPLTPPASAALRPPGA